MLDFFDGEFVDFGVADDTAFADVAAAGFELRLDKDTASVSEGAAAKTGARSSVAEMKETSMTRRVECGLAGFCECAGSEEAGIGALDEADARVVAELHGDLAEAGVDGGDVRGAALQKAVGKAAGGAPMSRQELPVTSIFQWSRAA